MFGKKFQIRRMQPEELQIAIDWAAIEGWNPGLHDSETFYQADPNGFFIGEIQGQPVAVGSAVNYDDQFAFCGLYIVHPEYRGIGYGLKLTQARLNYVAERNAGIDGVLENISIYERIGYRLAYQNSRYQSLAKVYPEHQAIVPLNDVDFSELQNYDRRCFPAARAFFLQAWINQPDALALAYVFEGQLLGYGIRRQCIKGHKIGPLFANNYSIADALFKALQAPVSGQPVFLDITSLNPAAFRLVSNHKMQEVFSTGRMYLKGQPDLDDEKIYGITTFELG